MLEMNPSAERDKALLLMAVLKDGDRARSLLSFLPGAHANELTPSLEDLLKILGTGRKEAIQQRLDQLFPENRESLLKFADAGWISECLREEPPAILSLLLNELPKAKVGRILKDLSKQTRKELKTRQVSKVPYEVLKLLHKKLEEKFPSIPKESLQNLGPYEKLASMSTSVFLNVIRELGLHEMALAFSKMHRFATRAILHRLNVKDAKELRDRIKAGEEMGAEVQRQAQLNILSLDVEKMKTEELVLEIGFSVFAKSFGEDYEPLTPLFIYKLPPKQGYLLKRYLDLHPPLAHSKTLRIRERLEEAVDRVNIGNG